MIAFTAAQKKKGVERELRYRRRVYPRMVAVGKLSQATADEFIAMFEDIQRDYSAAVEAERLN